MYTVKDNAKYNRILDCWCAKETTLMLKSLRQVLYKERDEINEDVVVGGGSWFLLELTDGVDERYVEMRIEKEAEMGENSLNVNMIYKYFKTVFYVDKKEWSELFKCGIVKLKGLYNIVCVSC